MGRSCSMDYCSRGSPLGNNGNQIGRNHMNITTTSLGRDVFSAVNGQHTLLAINLWSHFEPILKLKYADVNDWIAKLQQRENGVVLILDQPVAILEVDIFSGHKGKISQLSWYTLQSNLVNEIARNGIEISFLNGCVEAQYEEIFLERRFIRIGKEQYNGNSKLQNIKSESTVPTSDSSTSESSV